ETGGQRHVRGIASTPDQNPSGPGDVVTSVECVPDAGEIDLEPRAVVHWSFFWWHANVAKIAGAIASGNVQAATQRHRQVGEVAAHASALVMYIVSAFGGCCKLVAEGQTIVHVVADRLHARPTQRSILE